MNKEKPIALYVFFLILASMAFYVWWAMQPKKLIIGTWERPSEVLTIYPNETVTIKTQEGAFSGSYKFIDNKTLRFDLGGLGALAGPIILEYKVSSLELILNDKKTSRTYKRTSDTPAIPFLINVITSKQ